MRIFYSQVFLLSILWCKQTTDHRQEELAKFGYRSEKKLGKHKNPAIFLQPAVTCCLNMAIPNQSLKCLWEIFFNRILCMSSTGLLLNCQVAKNCWKENLKDPTRVKVMGRETRPNPIFKTLVSHHHEFPASLNVKFNIVLVWPVQLAQVLPHPQLIFPSKTWFFWEFIWILSGTNHLKINISHILNPNLTK